MQIINNLKIFFFYNFFSITNYLLFRFKKILSKQIGIEHYQSFDKNEINLLDSKSYKKKFKFHGLNIKVFFNKDIKIYSYIGLVLNKNKTPINFYKKTTYKKKKNLRYRLPLFLKNKKKKIMGKTILFSNPGQNLFNYFHFLIDLGLQLFIVNQKKIRLNNLILFSKKNLHREKFIKLFCPNINIIYCNKNEIVYVKELISITPYYLSNYLGKNFCTILKKYKFFLEKKLNLQNINLSKKKIFINRKESRQINNLKYFKDIIQFKEIYFSSDETIKKQSKKIRTSSHIIGLHGAGLTNILFSNKKAAIIELLPEYYPSSIFQRLSKSLDLKYNNIKLKKNYFNGTIMTKKNIKEVSNFIKTN